MKRLFTFIALVAMSIGAWAWTWTGTTPAHNNSYYMYNTAKNRWMWDTQYYDGDFHEKALNTDTLKWTVSGSAVPGSSSTFTLTSANGKQFSHKNQKWANRIETMMTGLSGKRVNLQCDLQNGKYSLYFKEKDYSGGQRNVNSTSDTRLETGSNAAYEWLFVDSTEMAVYNNRVIYFVADPIYEGKNGTVYHVDATYELANVGENNQEHKDSVIFKAVAKSGYVFAGWSETEGGEIVSTEENYEVELTFSSDVTVSNSITKTLYANFEVGVVTPTIEKLIDKLDWYTTYNVADLFASTNTESELVVKNGEDVITSFTTKNESSITLTVSQAAVEGKYYAVENQSFTFTVGAKDACDELGYVVNDATGKSSIENNNVLEYSWIKDNSLPFDEVKFDVEVSFLASRTLHVSVYTDDWYEVYQGGAATGVNITTELANYANATAIKFAYTGGVAGSATVKNVKVHVAAAELSAEQTSINAETEDVANWSDEISVKYLNIAKVQYEVTDVAATKGNATVELTPQETIDNECGDFGYYHFAVSATCDEVGSTITANAHFYTADGKNMIVPITINVKKHSQTLNWSDEVSTIFDNAKLNVTATATSGLAVTYGSDNADVIKYENGAWVVAGVGTATIHASQAGNDTYHAANQIYMTITVLSAQTSKESGVDAWTNMPDETESETASMYVTTNGETLITKTAQYKHGTICLPYSGTVSGATLYRLVNSEKDEVGNVNGLVFEFLGEDAASSCNFEAGMPYVYFANDAQQAWTRTNSTSEDVQAKALSNGLTGTYERKKLTNNEYFLYTADDSFHKAGTNVVVPAFRAYITTDDMENVADLQTPGKAQIRFGFEGYKPVATGMENAVVMNATKALVNGKIVIIRGDKAYTINGSKLK